MIAKNREDYITFLVNIAVDKYIDKEGNEKDKLIELQFIDSFKFMASSLDSLMNNLVFAEVETCLVLRIIQSYNIIYFPEKGSIHMSICRPGITSKNPNFLP